MPNATDQGPAARTGNRRLHDASDRQSTAASSAQQWSRVGPGVGPIVHPSGAKTASAAPAEVIVETTHPRNMQHDSNIVAWIAFGLIGIVVVFALFGVNLIGMIPMFQPKDDGIVIEINESTQQDIDPAPKAPSPTPEPEQYSPMQPGWLCDVQTSSTTKVECPD